MFIIIDHQIQQAVLAISRHIHCSTSERMEKVSREEQVTLHVNSDYLSNTRLVNKPTSLLVRDSSDIQFVSFIISLASESVVITTINDKEEIYWNLMSYLPVQAR